MGQLLVCAGGAERGGGLKWYCSSVHLYRGDALLAIPECCILSLVYSGLKKNIFFRFNSSFHHFKAQCACALNNLRDGNAAFIVAWRQSCEEVLLVSKCANI